MQTDKMRAMFDQAKAELKLRQEKEQAEKEAKLLATPMQQLLPDIFEEKRAIPNCFLRGALFGIVKKGKRAIVKKEKIFTMSQYDVIFSGEQLDQNDLELWDTLIYLAKNHNVQEELRISLYELCKTMKLSQQKINRKALLARIQRLKFGVIEVQKGKAIYGGSLLDDYFIDDSSDGKLVIRYNKKLTSLFIDKDYTLISADVRHLLGNNQLARWIYNFYESHVNPMSYSIDRLQQLCRSINNQKDFKYKLTSALKLVKEAHQSTNGKSKWDFEITNENCVLIFKNGRPKNFNF